MSIAALYQSIALEKGEHFNQRSRKLSDEDKEYSITNHPIQGTGADGFKIALVDLDSNAGQDAQIVHIIHDKIIVETREVIAADSAVMVEDREYMGMSIREPSNYSF